MQIFYFVLNLEYFLLVFLLFPETSHYEIGQLLAQVLTLFTFCFHSSFSFADKLLKCNALLLPVVFEGGGCGEGHFVPDGFLAQFEFSDILLYFSQFVPVDPLVVDSVFVVGVQSFLLLHHHGSYIVELSLLPLHYFLYCHLHLFVCVVFLGSHAAFIAG